MLLGTQTDRFGALMGDLEAVKLLCKTRFDAIDLSLFHMYEPKYQWFSENWKNHAESLRYITRENGVIFHQVHAPFPSYIAENDAYNKKTFIAIVRSIEIAAFLGAKTVIVHPFFIDNGKHKGVPDLMERNIEFYHRLQPYCEQYGLKIALENMWGYDDEAKKIIPSVCSLAKEFVTYMDALDSRYFTACLDLGHCGLTGETAPDTIRALGHNRLTALHVHDNDNIDDLHTAPFFGKLNWDDITTALAEIQYNGIFTFEADNFFLPIPLELLPSAARFLHDIGRHLIQQIEEKKKILKK